MTTARHESVRIALPAGGFVQGDVWWASERRPWAVLFVHGFGSVRKGEKAEALQQACARRDWTFAAFEFRGHGESSGTMLELCGSGLLADLDAIRGYFAERGLSRICPVGSSMGGWAVAWYTLTHPEAVPGCVLLAPAFHFLTNRWSRLNEAERRAWKKTGRLRVVTDWIDCEIGYGLAEEIDRFPHERLLKEWRQPLLICHGLRDDLVPYQQSLDFLERAAHPNIELRLLKDGDHRLNLFRHALAEGSCDFFTRHLSGTS